MRFELLVHAGVRDRRFVLVRKEIFSSDSFDGCDLFPLERFLCASLGSTAAMFVLVVLMRVFAEFEFMGFEGELAR